MSKGLLFCLFMALAGASFTAAADDPAVEALDGAWVVQVGNQVRDRFLIVTGSKHLQNRVVPGSATYGWIDGKGKPVRNWQAGIFGDSIHLSFDTPADSLIKVSFKVDETTVSGDMLTKGGKNYDVRMTRVADDELVALRAAAADGKKGLAAAGGGRSNITKDSKIYLVYVGAEDCPPCRRFSSYYGDGQRLKEIAPELIEARYVKAELWRFKDPLTAASLPDELKWLVVPNASGKAPLRKRGTPFFAAVVDKQVLAQGHGTTALETLVVPQIKHAVEQRRSAN